MKRITLSLSVLSLAASFVSANVLDLTYTEVQNGSLYDYGFTLSVDPSYSLQAGDSWSWIVFGDAENAASPLADFTLTSAPPGPFGPFTLSSGFHNGPSWLDDPTFNLVYWAPSSQTDSISWSGTSASYIAPGDLLYSELLSTNNAPQDSFAVATPQAVPEPASWLALGLGIATLALIRKRSA